MKGTNASKVKPDLKNERKRLLKNSTSESPAKKQKFKSLLELSSNNVRTLPQQRLTTDLDQERPRLLEESESSADQDFFD